MATGRTHPRFCRAYIDGYDMSGYSRMYGPLAQTFDEGQYLLPKRQLAGLIADYMQHVPGVEEEVDGEDQQRAEVSGLKGRVEDELAGHTRL